MLTRQRAEANIRVRNIWGTIDSIRVSAWPRDLSIEKLADFVNNQLVFENSMKIQNCMSIKDHTNNTSGNESYISSSADGIHRKEGNACRSLYTEESIKQN